MVATKRIADIVTFGRLGLGIVLVWLGLSGGAQALPLAAWLMILAWTADSLDGPLARRSQVHYATWIGEHDLWVDMAVATGLLVFMLAGGFVDPSVAMVYLLIWALAFWRWGVPRELGEIYQAPIYAWFIYTALISAPSSGWLLIGWILIAVVITWPKFPRVIVPAFLEGMRQMLVSQHEED